MDTRRALAAATLLAGLAVVGQIQLVAQTTQRALYVSVLNEAGAPVPDLGPSDFIVREDNVAREVLKVAPATEPMQVALLIDNSQAARDYITHYRQALPTFVTALADAGEGSVRNEVAIIGIADRPTILTEYTTNIVNLKKGIDRLWSQRGSGAYLLDGIYETAKGFKKRDAQRPVIVAITAEGPELSNYHYDQVLG
ncbi:MAG TPA: hypothetical protein VGG73_10815, partial [Vicinamibacterales bacterium]